MARKTVIKQAVLGKTTGVKNAGGLGAGGGFVSLPVTGQAPSWAPAAGSSTTRPSAAAPATPSVLPPDPGYDATRAALASKRDQTISGLQGQRASTLLDYGYTEQPGAGSLSFDAQNPFSRAAQLKLRYDQARNGANTSYAARGQLYSGALQNARNELNRQQAGAEDSLQKSLLAFLAQNTGQQSGAQSDFELGDAQALSQRLANAASNPLYQPAVAGETPVVASPGDAPSGPASATSSVGLGNGVTVSGGRFLYRGRELTQKQWDMLNRGIDPFTGKRITKF